jgi:mono/diheme cytochrome c family protein
MKTLGTSPVIRLAALAVVASSVVCLLAPARVAAQDKSTQDGVFSEDQASSGQETFETICASCHTTDQFGEAFIQSWAGATVGDMYDLISALMPEDQPGSLEPAQYVAVLSYIFYLNGLPTGPDALGEEKAILGSIRIEN